MLINASGIFLSFIQWIIVIFCPRRILGKSEDQFPLVRSWFFIGLLSSFGPANIVP